MRHNLGDSLWKVTSRRIVRSLKHMGSVAFTLIPGALGYVSNGLFPHPLQSTLPAFICIVEYPSEWDFFWNELIWKLLPCKQFSSAAKNTIVSSSEIRGLDFPFACFYIGLCGPKSFLPHHLPHGTSDRARGHLSVAFTESFRKVLSHLVFLIQQSSGICLLRIFDWWRPKQLQFIVLLLLAEFYLLSHCLPQIIMET